MLIFDKYANLSNFRLRLSIYCLNKNSITGLTVPCSNDTKNLLTDI